MYQQHRRGTLRKYLPGKTTDLAMVRRAAPTGAHWPFRSWQIIGGRTWSLSVIRLDTHPVVTGASRLPGN